MFGVLEYFQFRAWIQLVDPGDGFFDVDQFVLVTLQDQPWACRLAGEVSGETGNSGRNADQARWISFNGSLYGHCRAEGKSPQPQRQVWLSLFHPFYCCENICQLAVTLIKAALAGTHTTKIET